MARLRKREYAANGGIIHNSARIRVILVDDHEMVRHSLTLFLAAFSDLELVGVANSGTEALRLCAELKPDVVLMDLLMPGLDGITTMRLMHQQHPDTQVIALTGFLDEAQLRAALQAGAISYLLKDVSIDELAQTIRAAKAGRPVLAPEAARLLMTGLAGPVWPGPALTDREREVLTLLVEGLNTAQIAQRLEVSRSTVKSHISHIMAGLGVTNRRAAVNLALQKLIN